MLCGIPRSRLSSSIVNGSSAPALSSVGLNRRSSAATVSVDPADPSEPAGTPEQAAIEAIATRPTAMGAAA
jgi:hypothetical protein